MKIGKKIKTLRSDRKLNTSELAALSEVSQSTISEIESDTRSPRLDTLEKICAALKVPIMEVLPVEHHLNMDTASLSIEEMEVLALFLKMKREEREHFIALFSSLLEKRKK